MSPSALYLLFAWILDFSLQVYAQHYTHPDTYVPDTLHYPTIHRTRSCYSFLLLVTTTPLALLSRSPANHPTSLVVL